MWHLTSGIGKTENKETLHFGGFFYQSRFGQFGLVFFLAVVGQVLIWGNLCLVLG